MSRRALAIAVLVVTGLLASWGAWLLRPLPPPDESVGPPRSDYTLDDYRLLVADKLGKVAFTSSGPYLARNPNDETLNLVHPQFRFPDKGGHGDWTAHSDSGWVSAKGDEVRLARAVALDGPPAPSGQTQMRTEQLTVHPQPQTAHSDLPVTITRGASILRGTGMNADLKASRLELLSKVSLHDVPQAKQ